MITCLIVVFLALAILLAPRLFEREKIMFIVTLRADPGAIGESTLTLECVRIEQDPIFETRVLLCLSKPLALKRNGSPITTKRWSVEKADVLDWYEVDKESLDKLARELSERSLSLSEKKAEPAPAPKPAEPEPAPDTPLRVEVIKPEVEMSVDVKKGTVNVSFDLDDDEGEP